MIQSLIQPSEQSASLIGYSLTFDSVKTGGICTTQSEWADASQMEERISIKILVKHRYMHSWIDKSISVFLVLGGAETKNRAVPHSPCSDFPSGEIRETNRTGSDFLPDTDFPPIKRKDVVLCPLHAPSL
jgi:hypothetical protein